MYTSPLPYAFHVLRQVACPPLATLGGPPAALRLAANRLPGPAGLANVKALGEVAEWLKAAVC